MQCNSIQQTKYLLFQSNCIKPLEIIYLWKRWFHILHEPAICIRRWKITPSFHLIWWWNFNKSFPGLPLGTSLLSFLYFEGHWEDACCSSMVQYTTRGHFICSTARRNFPEALQGMCHIEEIHAHIQALQQTVCSPLAPRWLKLSI